MVRSELITTITRTLMEHHYERLLYPPGSRLDLACRHAGAGRLQPGLDHHDIDRKRRAAAASDDHHDDRSDPPSVIFRLARAGVRYRWGQTFRRWPASGRKKPWRVVPRLFLCPRLFCAQGFFVPKAFLCPRLFCAQGFFVPKAFFCPRLFCAHGFFVPKAFLCEVGNGWPANTSPGTPKNRADKIRAAW